MKIGFVTTHQYQNFGTFLQCFALQKILQILGHDTEIIDYRREEFKRSTVEEARITIGDFRKNPMSYISNIPAWFLLHERRTLFDKFAKDNFKISQQSWKTSDDLKLNPPQYDLYMSGSDQIWNPAICGFIEPYFLTFAPKNSLKVSYASSIGLSHLSKIEMEQISIMLSTYKFLSCREKTGCKLLADCGYTKVEHVLDPTLLLDISIWDAMANKSKINKTNYNLCYFLTETSEKRAQAKELLSDAKIENLTTDFRYSKEAILAAGPYEFLSLIRNAKTIVTDSFHGMLFSILFCKDFYMLPSHQTTDYNHQNSRIIDMLSSLGLSSRWCPISKANISPIDYTIIKNKINILRLHSIEYLQKVTKV